MITNTASGPGMPYRFVQVVALNIDVLYTTYY